MKTTAGIILLDVLFAALLVGVFGGALMGGLAATTRKTHKLKSDFLMRQLGMDALDRMAAGWARNLLRGPMSGGKYFRELSVEEWEQLVPNQVRACLAPMDPHLQLELVPVFGLKTGEVVHSARVSCTLRWIDPVRGAAVWTGAVITDAL